MKALGYEIKAYEIGYSKNPHFTKEHFVSCGKGKRAKASAIKMANEMWYTGKYEAVFVDAYNDEEIVDDECVNIPTDMKGE